MSRPNSGPRERQRPKDRRRRASASERGESSEERAASGRSPRAYYQVCSTTGLFEPLGATPKRSNAIDMTSWKTGAAVEPPPALL